MNTLLKILFPSPKGEEIKAGISKITQVYQRPQTFNQWISGIHSQLNECRRTRPKFKNRMYSKQQFNF